MSNKYYAVRIIASLSMAASSFMALPVLATHAASEPVQVWQTNPASGQGLTQASSLQFSADTSAPYSPLTIAVDDSQTYQKITGFGAALTDSSAWLIHTALSPAAQANLFDHLFSRSGLGLSLLRLPMGASDFTETGNYSYDDMPTGQTDPTLTHFSIQHDIAYIIPELQQIRGINPGLGIIASPWSPPGWMKTTGSMIGGSLLPAYFSTYANYFVDFLKQYQHYGVPIDFVTAQNEPLYVPSTYPGMYMSPQDQATFIGQYLGPDLAQQGLSTKILAYDHNWYDPSYPEAVEQDPTAAKYIAGTAWHCYWGDVSSQSAVHDAVPGKDAYLTECSGGTWEVNPFETQLDNQLIGGLRNWARGVILWNLALDPNHGPTNQGCLTCRGVVTINPTTGTYSDTTDYEALAQVSKFVQPGAYRIASNTYELGSIEDVAFRNPDGSIALVAYNSDTVPRTFKVLWGTESFVATLPAGSADTFTWSGTATQGLTLGSASAQAAVPGASVTLSGTDFGSVQGTSTVLINGVQAAVSSWSNSAISFTMPSGLTGSAAHVQVMVQGIVSNAVPLTVDMPLARTGWTASGTINTATDPGDSAAGAIDGNLATRWSDGTAQNASTQLLQAPATSTEPPPYFQVDMGTVQAVNQITLDAGTSAGDDARSFAISTSTDGIHFGAPVFTGGRYESPAVVSFPVQYARFLRVTLVPTDLTAFTGNWWSIAEFTANGPAPDATYDLGAPIAQTGFTATGTTNAASDPGDIAAHAIDGTLSTRFSTGAPQSPGQYLRIDLGTEQTFDRVVLDSGSSVNDYARGYAVYVSSDGVHFGAPVATGQGTGPVQVIDFPLQTGRYIQIVQTGTSNWWWSVAELHVFAGTLPTAGWSAAGTTTPAVDATDVPDRAIDGNLSTRFSTGAPQSPGQNFTVDMGALEPLAAIQMDAGASIHDDPQGYQVYLSRDGVNWGSPVATGTGSGPLTNVTFPTQVARFIKVVQTGSSAYWWSIAEFHAYVGMLPQGAWTATASSYNGSWDQPANAVDGSLATRFSTGVAQRSGQWFAIDLGQSQTVYKLTLDTGASSATDYPRGYQVLLSEDGTHWSQPVASGSGQGELTKITFTPQSARFLRIVQTGTAPYWWSIAECSVN